MRGDDISTVSISEGGRPAWVTRGAAPVVGLRQIYTDTVFEFGNMERLTIGSGARNDVVLSEDPTVSKSHCLLERHRGRVLLLDLGSRNGTYINGIVCQRVELRDGAILTLGRTHLVAYSARNRQRLVARERIAGRHPSVLEALRRADRAATEGLNVLIVGEPGTGKALLAEVIHELARGPGLPFVTVDCADPEAPAQLFGDEPGALDRAAGGTLFVREPSELSERNTTRLFEALRQRTVRQISTLHLVAATSYASATIRPYEAICPLLISLPPLRQRRTDIPELVEMFLDQLLGRQRREPSKPAMSALMRHDWPGNIAELRQAVELITALATSPSKSKAAERLSISRTTLDRRMKRWSIPAARQGESLW